MTTLISHVIALFALISVNCAKRREAPPQKINLFLTDKVPIVYIQTPGYPDKNYLPSDAVLYNITVSSC